MKYPQFIKNGTTVAVAAPSFGVAPDDTDNYNRAKLFFENKGYKVTEAPSLFKEDLCASAPASVRAEEFTQLYENVITVCGKEFDFGSGKFEDHVIIFAEISAFPDLRRARS